MFAVIFVVQPKAAPFDEYLNLAKFLKPELEKIDGFIRNGCFGSTEGRVVSLSSWRRVRVMRDHGMSDCREAPQHYRPVQPVDGSR